MGLRVIGSAEFTTPTLLSMVPTPPENTGVSVTSFPVVMVDCDTVKLVIVGMEGAWLLLPPLEQAEIHIARRNKTTV